MRVYVRVHVSPPFCSSSCDAVTQCHTCHQPCLWKLSFTRGTVSVLQPLSRRSELREGRRILRLENLMASFLLSNASSVVATARSRLRLLDIVENLHKYSSITLDVQSLKEVAKGNIHVRAKVLVNLMLTGSYIRGNQPKCVFHMHHLPSLQRNNMTYHTNGS